jgi:hypothetical protein
MFCMNLYVSNDHSVDLQEKFVIDLQQVDGFLRVL